MLACLDLEGVLLPEIWVKFAEKTGIEELKLTTREIPDYDELMQARLKILADHNLKIHDIQKVIATLSPLEGAVDFLQWLKSEFQVIILSDTYYEFIGPLMKQLDYPTVFCHNLVIDKNSLIIDYKLRQTDQKTKAVKALQSLNFQVISAGDSYNDTGMLQQADGGILFCPPENVIKDFPQFPVAKNYTEFKSLLISTKEKILNR
ncbi:MAG: bifunctional phosphoserine phosphatase/homoserine phosphotransferase ThrH [Proteobacteria bacterium]|nr:bifunctional phosphoserine phosphatase/homoserine phosphotransferase ThrH [Pseudomonadota bacterium]